jgi:diguanylate cyclase (GGDEF)-like protein
LLPHFYQTLWFRLLLAALAVLAAIGLLIQRTRSVMLRARELEVKVAQRTAELIAANGQLTDFEEELRLQNVQLKDAQGSVEIQNEELHAMQAELMAQNDELQSVQAELESQNQEMLETQDRLTEANKQLEALATTDGLTGLFNHRMFHEQLEQEWSRHARYGTALSVILIDVDKFKLYNDSHGHPAGDDVLRKVAEVLQSTARRSDVVARYGGEEFVIIARETDIRAAVKLAERLRAAIEGVDWPLRSITASLGVSSADPSTTYPADLVAQADAALYRSKNAGRNRATHYRDPDPTAAA